MAQNVDHTSTRGAFVAALAFGLLGVLAIGVLSMKVPAQADQVGVVFPFSYSERQSLAAVIAAGGVIVRFGGIENIVVAQFDGMSHDQIRQHSGAMWLISPTVAGACISLTTT